MIYSLTQSCLRLGERGKPDRNNRRAGERGAVFDRRAFVGARGEPLLPIHRFAAESHQHRRPRRVHRVVTELQPKARGVRGIALDAARLPNPKVPGVYPKRI